jgi:hypothetical protein
MLPRIYDGSGKPAPERVTLTAGKLTLEFEAGTLRYIRLGKHEIVRSLYAAVRDHNWGTVPAELCDLNLDIRVDSFAISFTSDHQQGDIHFAWRGVIAGTADSTITFSFNGEALTGFKRNRIGFCVLHPMDVSGKAVTVEHVDGVTEQGAFPQLISPHQPYFNIRALTHEVIPGVQAEVRMEGDTFEMEDQRNWTDASFKTYCTPLSLPFPAFIEAGTTVSQSITVRLIGDVANVAVSDTAPTLHLSTNDTKPIPPIGLCAASHGEPLTAHEIDRLRIVLSGDLRVEIDFSPGWEARLEQAKREASALATRLFIVVFLARDDRAEAQLSALVTQLRDYEQLSSLLVLREGETTTSAATSELIRARFDQRHISLCAGTNGYFTQLNRNRPLGFQPDIIAYSVNPQVHAFDNASLIETLAALKTTVATARSFAPDAKIAVTPVTFKIRQNPDATAPEPPTPPGQLPRRVDPRQMSLFGAGWTMGAIASLALAGADSLTFFETTGWLGVMEHASGSPLPDLFPSIPGGVFPMYHVFADVAEFAGGQVMSFTASHPLNFSGLALRRNGNVRLLVANHMQAVRTLTITGVSGAWMLKTLDEHTAHFSMTDPESYRAALGKPVTASADGLTLELLPYAVARLDQADAS